MGQGSADAPNLLPFLVYNSMEPWLEAAGEALSSAYPQNDVWQHGHCPVCGSPAFIGHLSGPELSRNEGGTSTRAESGCIRVRTAGRRSWAKRHPVPVLS